MIDSFPPHLNLSFFFETAVLETASPSGTKNDASTPMSTQEATHPRARETVRAGAGATAGRQEGGSRGPSLRCTLPPPASSDRAAQRGPRSPCRRLRLPVTGEEHSQVTRGQNLQPTNSVWKTYSLTSSTKSD